MRDTLDHRIHVRHPDSLRDSIRDTMRDMSRLVIFSEKTTGPIWTKTYSNHPQTMSFERHNPGFLPKNRIFEIFDLARHVALFSGFRGF